MANFNQVILLGNLTRDPQLRYLPSQTAVVDFGMAVNRKWRDPQGQDREEVMFIDCSAFGKQAEVINQYCQKGRLLFIQGRLKLDTWEDKQGGGKRSKHTVVVDSFQLMPNRDGGGGGGGMAQGGEEQRPQRSAPSRPAPRQPQQPQQPPAQGEAPFGDEQQFKEDDIPF